MMYTHSPACPAPLSRPARLSVLSRLIQALAVTRQRARLADLDAAALRDIGVTRAQAMHEAKRPFWDAPDHWQR